MAKANGTMSKLIDRAGELNSEIKEMQKELSELKTIIKDTASISGVYSGKRYVAEIEDAQLSLTIDPKEYFDKCKNKKDFFSTVKVELGKAKRISKDVFGLLRYEKAEKYRISFRSK